MIWPFIKTTPKLGHSALALDPFIAEVLKGQVLKSEDRPRLLIEFYIYGAIRYLASYDDLNDENSKELMHKMLADHFEASREEVNGILKRITDAQNGKTEQLFMIEGASALRRWLVKGDREDVSNDLIELLEMHASN